MLDAVFILPKKHLINKAANFQSTLVPFLAEIGVLNKHMLRFLQQQLPGLDCYRYLLPSFMPSHDCFRVCDDDCELVQILRLGADPDPAGFRVTPLQIAVRTRDVAGARTLLAAGASPNNAGDGQGIDWRHDTVLAIFSHFHGHTPLHLLRHMPPVRFSWSKWIYRPVNVQVVRKIEHLLLYHSASKCCN